MSEGGFDLYAGVRNAARRAHDAKGAWNFTPGLPVDGDAPETRRPSRAPKSVFEAALAAFRLDANPFYDVVCEAWPRLFPDLPARPLRWTDNRLILAVASAGQAFALRPKLSAVKRALAALPHAPKRFLVHVEIRGKSVKS